MTSNLGSEALSVNEPSGDIPPKVRDQVMQIVRQTFRPEFLNRLDDIIIFNRLHRDDMKTIVRIQLKTLEKRLADKKITLHFDEEALQWLAEAGYDPVYGARPLKRVIQRQVQDPLSLKILSGDVADGSEVVVTVGMDGLELNGK